MKLGDLTGVPLPNGAAGSRAATTGDKDGGANLAWRREMERAQSEAWFLGTLPTSSTVRQTAALPAAVMAKPVHAPAAHGPTGHPRQGAAVIGASIESHPGHGERSASSSAAHDASASRAERVSPAAIGTAVARTMAISMESAVQLQQSPGLALRLTALATPRGALEVPVEVRIGAPTEETPATAEEHSAAASRTGRLPVRVHVEGDATQSTVWLGVDAAALAQLPGLAAAVRRWLMNAGYGTPSWICNGQPMSAEQIAEGAGPAVEDARDARFLHRSPPMNFVLNQTFGETV